MKKKILLCGGQGSQYYFMGKTLFEKNPIFKKSMNRFEVICQEYGGYSLIEELFDNKSKRKELDNVIYSYPGLYAIQMSLYEVLKEKQIYPDAVLGYSMGEYIAATISGFFDSKEGMRLLIDTARVLKNIKVEGKMLTVLGKLDDVKNLLHNVDIVSNSITGKYFTISGEATAIHYIKTDLKKKGYYSAVLPVQIPFHSRVLDLAKEEYVKVLTNYSFASPKIPMYSATTTSEILSIDEFHLWNVIRSPILYEETIETLECKNDWIYIDISPSGSLAALLKQQKPQLNNVFMTMNRFGQDISLLDKLEKELRKLDEIKII